MTVVIVREDLIANGPARADICPTYLDLRVQAEKGSMYNTPNTFGIYLCGKVFRWIEQTDGLVPNTFGIYLCGKVFRWIEQTDGLVAMAQRNRAKADLLYRTIDDSDLFQGTADPKSRSMSNVTFRTCDAETDEALASTCAARSSAGSSRPTGSSPWRSATEQRPTCSTAPSTIATSSRARRTPKAAP